MALICYEVLFDFVAEDEGELSIYVGEKVTGGGEADEDGWLYVTTSDNATGHVPMDYLKPCRDNFDPEEVAPDSAGVAEFEQPYGNSNSPPQQDSQSHLEPELESESRSQLEPDLQSQSTAHETIQLSAPPATAQNNFEPSDTSMGWSNYNNNTKLTADMLSPPEPEKEQQQQQEKTPDVTVRTSPPVPATATATTAAPAPKLQSLATPQTPSAASIFNSPYATGSKSITTAGMTVRPGSASSVNSLGRMSVGSSKYSLKSAAKSVASVNRAVAQLSTKTIPPAKPPTLLLSVERDNMDELLKKNNEYFSRVVASQGETLDSVTDLVDVLTKKLADASQVRSVCMCE